MAYSAVYTGRYGKSYLRPGDQYQRTTLGRTLQESLDELLKAGKITQTLVEKVLTHFDVHMNSQLSHVPPKVTFKAEKLIHYREVNKVFSFVLSDVTVSGRGLVKADGFEVRVPQVKFEAHPTLTLKKRRLAKVKKGASKPKPAPKKKDESSDDDDDDIDDLDP